MYYPSQAHQASLYQKGVTEEWRWNYKASSKAAKEEGSG